MSNEGQEGGPGGSSSSEPVQNPRASGAHKISVAAVWKAGLTPPGRQERSMFWMSALTLKTVETCGGTEAKGSHDRSTSQKDQRV